MLPLDLVYKTCEQHDLSNNSKKFLEWCAIKFNIEELLSKQKKKKYSSLPKMFTDLCIDIPSGAAAKQKLVNIIASHCKIDRPTQKIYELSEPTYLELSDFEGTYGVYRELFLLLFNNWLHIDRAEEIIILTREDIAIQMGILNCYYQLFKGTNTEYAEVIKQIDKTKRLDDLIDEQLFYMQKNSHTKGHFYKVQHVIVEYTKEIINIPEIADVLIRQIFKKEVEDTHLLNIYKKACKTNFFPPECDNITTMWKIIAPRDINFIPLSAFIQQLISRILIINKQDKVYRQLIIEEAKRQIDLEDRNNNIAIELRQEHHYSEMELDGETRYQEIEDPQLIKIINEEKIKQINPLRLVSGNKINTTREEAKERIQGTYTRKTRSIEEKSFKEIARENGM